MANIKGTNQNDVLQGTLRKDHINGKSGDDIIQGFDGNDKLMGGDGNDNLYGGKGNDDIDGGKGIDTAFYSGNFADYLIQLSGHNDLATTITDQTAGRDGTDHLRNVEFLQFHDGIFNISQGNFDHFGTVDAEAQYLNPPSQPQMYFGSGNPTGPYHIVQDGAAGFQIDLSEIYRTGDTIAPSSIDADGTAHFTAPAGTQVVDPAHNVSNANPNRSAWNFNYVVDTGVDGSTHTLADYDFRLVVTENGANTHVFDLNPTTHVWTDEANPTIGFGGDDFNHPASSTVQSQIAENSVNLAFLAGDFGPLATSTAAGNTYDITLQAFNHQNQLLGSVHDVIQLA